MLDPDCGHVAAWPRSRMDRADERAERGLDGEPVERSQSIAEGGLGGQPRLGACRHFGGGKSP